MNTPDFLIVGAMKSGTTTLYHDLNAHPDIFLPTQKEPETLVRFDDAEAIAHDYASLFKPAAEGQLLGEASTAYTKRPMHEGVAERARAVCGKGLRVIYIRRDPVERTFSQYEHEVQLGTIGEPLAEALRRHPRLIDYSRYDWQIAPWIEALGPDNVLELDLDAYSADRKGTVERVLRFLGADPARHPGIASNEAYNRRDEQKTIHNPLLRAVVYSNLYQRGLKRLMPFRLREALRNGLLPKAEVTGNGMDAEARRYVTERLDTPPQAEDSRATETSQA